MWCLLCALVALLCFAAMLCWHVPSDYPALFLSPYPTHASGSLLILQPVSDWLAAHHVVLVMCPVLFHVCCCLPMLARAPLTTLLCFLSPYPTQASGSLLILQRVSDWLCCPPCGAGYVPCIILCVLMAGYAMYYSMCVAARLCCHVLL